MSETPRTDEFWTARLKGPAISQRHPNNTEWVAFARQLERELNAALSARPEVGQMFEQLAQMCDEIGSQDYPKKDSTHGERLAWCHGAVACADAIRDRARSNMNSCKG